MTTKRESLQILKAAVEREPKGSPMRALVETCVELAETAISESEQIQRDAVAMAASAKDVVEKSDRVADSAIARATAAENEVLKSRRSQIEKRLIEARSQNDAVIMNALASVAKAFNDCGPMLANLIALKRWTWRPDSEQSCLTDLRKHGECWVWNPVTDSIMATPDRASAVALCKSYVEEYVDLSASKIKLEDLDVSLEKIGPGVNVDLPEEKNPGKVSSGNGAAASEWPRRNEQGRLDGAEPYRFPDGPRIADEDDDS
jgi:hypothetical protein